MTPRPKKIASALVAALAAVTMLGAGSAAAKTPPPQQPDRGAVEVIGSKDNEGGPKVVFTRSFKPRR